VFKVDTGKLIVVKEGVRVGKREGFLKSERSTAECRGGKSLNKKSDSIDVHIG